MTVKELIGASKQIILVTSAYHMYRAKSLFEKQEFIVIPYKVDYKEASINKFKLLDFLPIANNLE